MQANHNQHPTYLSLLCLFSFTFLPSPALFFLIWAHLLTACLDANMLSEVSSTFKCAPLDFWTSKTYRFTQILLVKKKTFVIHIYWSVQLRWTFCRSFDLNWKCCYTQVSMSISKKIMVKKKFTVQDGCKWLSIYF